MTADAPPRWLVLFSCGHARHPEPQYDGPPPAPGDGGYCTECRDVRRTVDVVLREEPHP